MPPVMTMANKPSKIAFVVGVFPAVSETWMINQITGLLDRGFDIDIYAFTSQIMSYIIKSSLGLR